MAGTQKKTDSTKHEDAPKLPDEAQPKPTTADDAPAEEKVAAQAQPMDEQESPTTPDEGDASDNVAVSIDMDHTRRGKFAISIDVTGVPKAEDVEVKEGEHDPSLVTIPGLGAFRNGTTTVVDAERIFLFADHMKVTGVTEGQMPSGVTIKKEGEK
jgi:hypothetical protein